MALLLRGCVFPCARRQQQRWYVCRRRATATKKGNDGTISADFSTIERRRSRREGGGNDVTQTLSLRYLWPRLQQRFDELADENGNFPLQYATKAIKRRAAEKEWEEFDRPTRQAAVLVLWCSVGGEASILFTRRSRHLKSHASEISFPGGHYEPHLDASLVDTALRETAEELLPREAGLIENEVEILGRTTKLPALSGMPVSPVLGVLWREIEENNNDNDDDHDGDNNAKSLSPILSHVFPGDPSEVDLVFAVAVRDLLEGETAEALPNGNRFGIRDAPVYPTEHGKIWGLTAFILRPLLRRLVRPALATMQK